METPNRRRKMNDVVSTLGITPPSSVPMTGSQITVSWGEETFSPVQYNSFRTGGHSVTVTVQEGETALDAWKRGWEMLQQAAEIEFKDKLAGFAERINTSKVALNRR